MPATGSFYILQWLLQWLLQRLYCNGCNNGCIAMVITMLISKYLLQWLHNNNNYNGNNIFYNGKFIQWLYYNGFIAVIITVVWFH